MTITSNAFPIISTSNDATMDKIVDLAAAWLNQEETISVIMRLATRHDFFAGVVTKENIDALNERPLTDDEWTEALDFLAQELNEAAHGIGY